MTTRRHDDGRRDSWLRTVFFGPYGLRAGWRLLLFNLLYFSLGAALQWTASKLLGSDQPPALTAPLLIWAEAASFALGLLATLLMGRLEGRSLGRYGFPLRAAFGGRFWEGAAWGVLSASGLVGMIALAGGYTVAGLRLAGGRLLSQALLWALAMLLVGLYEELVFRGYELYTLASGIRFWPAAVVLSAIFGFGLHYLAKPGETWVDGLSVSLIALFFCWSVRRTGDVWFAVGWHFTFNYASMFVFGSPNTGNQGQPLATRLLDSTWHGPQWLTGGAMGAEASAFVFIVIAILFVLLPLRFRGVPYPRPERDRRLAGGSALGS